MTDPMQLRQVLANDAAQRYRASGLFAWKFARGKLAGDPAYFGILEHALIPDSARVLDLGCGQGLVAAWLVAARARYDNGQWPAHIAAPPRIRHFTGIELMESDVDRARKALGDRAQFIVGDVRTAGFAEADAAIILDVLHYMSPSEQMAVLERVRDALQPSRGVLLLRVGDASAGWRFHYSWWVDRIVTFLRGHRLTALHCRPVSEWHAALESLGFAVDPVPMSTGTPFANVLLIARLDTTGRTVGAAGRKASRDDGHRPGKTEEANLIA